MGVRTVARNALRPGYFPEMARKVYLRGRYGERERAAGQRWAASHAEDLHEWGAGQDPVLWAEAVAFAEDLRRDAQPRIAALHGRGIHLGGGGCYALLYFLTRRGRPDAVLETGVGAGWSTRAILAALARNGHGHLYSSDFPLFRHDDPERLIGCLVPEELKGAWTLHTKGDRRNLGLILTGGVRPGLVHYDSDKSRGGREMFVRRVAPHLTGDAVVMMDDVNDDLFFRDHVAGRDDFHVFLFENKYVGIVGC